MFFCIKEYTKPLKKCPTIFEAQDWGKHGLSSLAWLNMHTNYHFDRFIEEWEALRLFGHCPIRGGRGRGVISESFIWTPHFWPKIVPKCPIYKMRGRGQELLRPCLKRQGHFRVDAGRGVLKTFRAGVTWGSNFSRDRGGAGRASLDATLWVLSLPYNKQIQMNIFLSKWMDSLFSKINIYNLTIIERSTILLEVLQSFCMRRPNCLKRQGRLFP